MVMLYEGKPYEFSMDGYLYPNLMTAKQRMTEDWDMVFIVDGKERSGKSCFAFQIAKFFNESFDLPNIVFEPDKFLSNISTVPKGTAIVYDEAFAGLNTRQVMSRTNIQIIKTLTECGFRNLILIIVLPSFFLLDKYVPLFRSRALFHVYADKNMRRGQFTFYNDEKMLQLYIRGRDYYNYNAEKANFFGSYTGKWVVNKEEYEKLKKEATDRRLNQLGKDGKGMEKQEILLTIVENMIQDGLTQKQVAKYLGTTQQTVSSYVQTIENTKNIELNRVVDTRYRLKALTKSIKIEQKPPILA